MSEGRAKEERAREGRLRVVTPAKEARGERETNGMSGARRRDGSIVD